MAIDRPFSQLNHPLSQAYEDLVDTCSRPEFWRQVKDEVCSPEMLTNIAFTIGTGFGGGCAGGFVEGRILGSAGFQNIERLGFSYLGKLFVQREFKELLVRVCSHQVNMAMVAGVCDLLGGHFSFHGYASSLINFNASHFFNWMAFPAFNHGIHNVLLRYVVQRLFGGAVFTGASHLQQEFERRMGWSVGAPLAAPSSGIELPLHGDHSGPTANLLKEYIHNTLTDTGVHHGNHIAQVGIRVSAKQFCKFAHQVGRATLWSSLGMFVGMAPGAVMQAPAERKIYASGIDEGFGFSVQKEVFLAVTEKAIASEDADERALGFSKRAMVLGRSTWSETEILPPHIVEAYKNELRNSGVSPARLAAFNAVAEILGGLRERSAVYHQLQADYAFALRDIPDEHLTPEMIRSARGVYESKFFGNAMNQSLFCHLIEIERNGERKDENRIAARELISTFPVHRLNFENPQMLEAVRIDLHRFNLTQLSSKQWEAMVEHVISNLCEREPTPDLNLQIFNLLLRQRRMNAEQARRVCQRIEREVEERGIRQCTFLLPLLALFGYKSSIQNLNANSNNLGLDTIGLDFLGYCLSISPLMRESEAAAILYTGLTGNETFLPALQGALARPGFRFKQFQMKQILKNPSFLGVLPRVLEILLQHHDREEFFDNENLRMRREDSAYYLEQIAQTMEARHFEEAIQHLMKLRPSREARRNLVLAMVRGLPLNRESFPQAHSEASDYLSVLEDHSFYLEEVFPEAIALLSRRVLKILEQRLLRERKIREREDANRAFLAYPPNQGALPLSSPYLDVALLGTTLVVANEGAVPLAVANLLQVSKNQLVNDEALRRVIERAEAADPVRIIGAGAATNAIGEFMGDVTEGEIGFENMRATRAGLEESTPRGNEYSRPQDAVALAGAGTNSAEQLQQLLRQVGEDIQRSAGISISAPPPGPPRSIGNGERRTLNQVYNPAANRVRGFFQRWQQQITLPVGVSVDLIFPQDEASLRTRRSHIIVRGPRGERILLVDGGIEEGSIRQSVAVTALQNFIDEVRAEDVNPSTNGLLTRIGQAASQAVRGVRNFLNFQPGEIAADDAAEQFMQETAARTARAVQLRSSLDTWWRANAPQGFTYELRFSRMDPNDFDIVVRGPNRLEAGIRDNLNNLRTEEAWRTLFETLRGNLG